jgi:hypothetical protein
MPEPLDGCVFNLGIPMGVLSSNVLLKSYGVCHLPDEKLQNGRDKQCCGMLDEDWVFIIICLISLQTNLRYYNSFTSSNVF